MTALEWALTLALLATPAFAQSQGSTLTGTWQGVRQADAPLKTELTFSGPPESPAGESHQLGLGFGRPVTNITIINGNNVRFDYAGGAYDGVLSADKNSIRGGFKAPGMREAQKLDLNRVNERVAWIAPHQVRRISVEPGVELEVLDWGGEGPPLIFLSGMTQDAHVFDKFAPLFAKTHHVYGITRRGHGVSSRPAPTSANYTNDRLGDDVLAVMDSLNIQRAVFAAWSFGGAELSNVASRKPERVAGAVYLDGAYGYSFYATGNLIQPFTNVLAQTAAMHASAAEIADEELSPQQSVDAASELLNSTLPQLKADLEALVEYLKQNTQLAPLPKEPRTEENKMYYAMYRGVKKYPAIKAPVLAFFAGPQKFPPNASASETPRLERRNELTAAVVKRFQDGNPSARVIILPNATHAVWTTDERIVEREMKAFMAALN